MSYLCPHSINFPLKTASGGSQEENGATVGGARSEEKYDWRAPNRLLVVQTGESIEQAKLFKAHAVLQGFCANLINALKLLANQREDGDCLLQNIVMDLGKTFKKRSHERLA